MRRALPHKIRKPKSALRTGGGRTGFFREKVVGITSGLHSGRDAEAFSQPAQRQSCSLRHTHHVPTSGNGVAKSVQPSLRIECRMIGRGKDHAGGPDGCTDCACARNAHADGAGRLIARTRNDWRSNSQAGGFRARGGDSSANMSRFVKRRKQAFINAGLAQNFARPAAVSDIQEKSARGIRYVDGPFSRKAESYVVFWQHYVRDLCPAFRLDLAHPEQLGESEIC